MPGRQVANSVWLTSLLLCGALSAAVPVDGAANENAANEKLSAVLAESVSRGDAPGVVAVVVDKKGEIFKGAAGSLNASKAGLPDNAIFNIASMTKPVTSVAIMMLMEQGKLSIDDPVAKYLPEFEHLQVLRKYNEADGSYETQPATKVMTICNLLTHTSGIGYAFSSAMLAGLQKGNDKTEWQVPLLHEPGERWTYGASTRALGLIVEKLSGVSLEEFYHKNIFVPLGMVDTSYAVPAAKQSRVIATFDHVGGEFKAEPAHPIPSVPTPPFRGDGGLYSTASDYGRFIRMFLNGGQLDSRRIISQRSVHMMSENQIGPLFVIQQPSAMPAMARPFPLGAGRDKFGLGFELAAGGDADHRRQGALSWAGIYNTEFWIDPKAGIGAVLLLQYLPFYDESAIRTLQAFEAAVYRSRVPK
jgi:methyl acetate hydrolase